MMKCPTSSSFSLLNFFVLLLPFLLFLHQRLTFYWAYFQSKKFWESIIEMGIFYHGVARWRFRKFLSKFFYSNFWTFSCISQAPLSWSLIWSVYHWKDLFLLQNFSIDVNFGKADDIRSGTKASKDHEIYKVWLSESCFQSNKLNRFHLPSSTSNFDIAYWAVNLSLFLRT